MKIRREFSSGGIVYRKLKSVDNKVDSNENNNSKLTPSNLEWLVCKHSQNKTWGFPKGLIGDNDKTESIQSAALREVREEGGINAKIILDVPVTTKYSYFWKEEKVNKEVKYFLMEYVSGDVKDHDWEMSEVKFVKENEVLDILSHKADKEAFEQILKSLR